MRESGIPKEVHDESFSAGKGVCGRGFGAFSHTEECDSRADREQTVQGIHDF